MLMMSPAATIRLTMLLMLSSFPMTGRLLQSKDFFKVATVDELWQEITNILSAFSTIMFAFSGASTFPTIQADMKDRRKFPLAAIFAMMSK